MIVLTEYQATPIGLQTTNPTFSWRYAVDLGKQFSYRVGVSSTRQNAETGKYDLWDSQEREGCECFGIEYAGEPLRSRQRCYVRVETNCENGRNISEISSFEIGLLQKSDWKGKWISVPSNFQGQTLFARKQFFLEKEIRVARAYVCGVGYYEVYLNGKKVGDACLHPGVTAYDKRVLYSTYDLMQYLQAGNNVIGVELGYGWYGSRKLLVQVYVEYADGSVYEDHTANGFGWWMSGGAVTDNSIYGGEVYDARKEAQIPINWATADYEPTWANGWMYPLLVSAPGGELQAHTCNEIKVCATFKPVSVAKRKGALVYDVGQNLAGWARIRVRGERGARITLKFAEGLKEDGTVNQLNLRSARCSDAYVLRGEGEEEWAPRFTYHGFQYVQAEIEGKAEILSLVAEHVHTDVPLAGSLETSDAALNRLHRNAVMTELNNLHSIMTDCPQRDERFGWLNDLGSRLYQTVYNCRMERFFPKFAQDITDTMDENGGIADTVPYFTGGRPADPVCIAYLMLGLYSYRYYGDRSVIEKQYEGMKRWVNYLLSCSENYRMNYYYYADWVPPACFTDVSTDPYFVSSAYLNWHLKMMSQIAEIAGNAADASHYRMLQEESSLALHKTYFDPKKMCYASGTQAENSLALSLGICPAQFADAVARNIYEDAVRHGHHCTCGNIGYRHFFYVMSDHGYSDEVLRILKNPEYPGWGYMLKNGATTVWERWEAEMQNEMHSFDHPMFGSYDAWMYRYVGGIDICEDAVACDKIAIDPKFPSDLQHAKVTFATVRGTISVSWKRAEHGIEMQLVIPPTTEARVMFRGVIDGATVLPGSILKSGTYVIREICAQENIAAVSCC